MTAIEVVFLTTLFLGILLLVSGLFVTRRNWRRDVLPFGRHSSPWHIARHPGEYAMPAAVPVVRVLNLAGAFLVIAAVLAIVYEAIVSILHR